VDEKAFRFQHLGADLNCRGRKKAGVAADDGAIRHAFQPGREMRAGIADDSIFARHDGGEINADRPDLHAEIHGPLREMSSIGARDQRLGRRAAGVDASPSDQIALDERDRLARRRKPADHRRSSLAGADHNRIEMAVHRSAQMMMSPRMMAPASSMNAAGWSRPNAAAM